MRDLIESTVAFGCARESYWQQRDVGGLQRIPIDSRACFKPVAIVDAEGPRSMDTTLGSLPEQDFFQDL